MSVSVLGVVVGMVVAVPLVFGLLVWWGRRRTPAPGPGPVAGRPRRSHRQRSGFLVVDGEPTARYEICPSDGWPRYYWN